MLTTCLVFSLVLAYPGESSPMDDAGELILEIEALLAPVEDFRCEFEGTVRFKGPLAAAVSLGADGLYEQFSGIFVWRQGGDTYSDSMHRRGADDVIGRQTVVVRMSEQRAERHDRANDASVGSATIKTPSEVNSWVIGSLGRIFLIDKLKRDIAEDRFDMTVGDDRIDDRPLKTLDVAVKNVPNSRMMRYWIDLRRNGHVVKAENYMNGKVMGRTEITLAPFRVDGSEVWMPVRGESTGFGAMDGKMPIVTDEPTSEEITYVVARTLEFNKRPGPQVFTINYKPGTPISDDLRKLTYQFGQKSIGSKPTKAATEAMLAEQIKDAEAQRKTLAAVPVSQEVAWSSWIAWILAATAMISMMALVVQKSRR